MNNERDSEDSLAFTVATVWREERVSCPHIDILRGYLADALAEGAKAFVDFHLSESMCPFCRAVLEDLRQASLDVERSSLSSLRDKLMRSTVAALRKASRA